MEPLDLRLLGPTKAVPYTPPAERGQKWVRTVIVNPFPLSEPARDLAEVLQARCEEEGCTLFELLERDDVKRRLQAGQP